MNQHTTKELEKSRQHTTQVGDEIRAQFAKGQAELEKGQRELRLEQKRVARERRQYEKQSQRMLHDIYCALTPGKNIPVKCVHADDSATYVTSESTLSREELSQQLLEKESELNDLRERYSLLSTAPKDATRIPAVETPLSKRQEEAIRVHNAKMLRGREAENKKMSYSMKREPSRFC